MLRWLTQVRLAARSLFHRERVDAELDEELQDHLQREIDEALKRGLNPREARFAALRSMGAIAASKDEARDMRGLNFIDDVLRDLRYAVRSLGRNPGFALLVVFIMALGIGANTAVFSVVSAVLLKPLPYADPDRIVALRIDRGDSQLGLGLVTLADSRDWRDQNSSFEALAAYAGVEFAVSPGGTAEFAQLAVVDRDFFRVFGVAPMLGRTFTAEEMRPGGRAALISHGYWQRRFGGDAGVLQRTVRVGDDVWSIIGVLPQGFAFPTFPKETDIWLPQQANRPTRTSGSLFAAARLKPGVSLEQAQTEMRAVAARLERQYPDSNQGRSVAVSPLRDQLVGRIDRLTLYLLWGAVGVVLLIACANTAMLLLGKATARTREVAVRAALGASRRRIVRQLITESLLLAGAAGASGLLLAWWGAQGLTALVPAGLPAQPGIDGSVLAFTLAVTFATSLLFGLVPALHASKVDLNQALSQEGSRTVAGRGMVRARGILVVAEVALAVVLLMGAGLLTKSLLALHNVELGYQPENLLMMKATGVSSKAENNEFFREMLARTAALPGVIAAGATMAPPGNWGNSPGLVSYFIDRMPAQWDRTREAQTLLLVVAPGLFRALGIPMTRGRDFGERDTLDSPKVAIVNEALVRQAFGAEDPIGRTIFCNFDGYNPMTIVGVVGNVRQFGPSSAPSPICYLPYQQHTYNNNTLSVVARTAGDPTKLAATLRRVAAEISPKVPVTFTTMEETVSNNVAAPRFRTFLLVAFAALAVCLALTGVYGVVAYAVSQRSSEVGLRMALGATPASVLRLFLRQGLVLAGAGLAAGLSASAAGSHLLTALLFEVKPSDPLVYLAVAALIGSVTLTASLLPAWRASMVSPLMAIQNEPGSTWQSARLKARQVIRELSTGERPAVGLGTLIAEFAGSVRGAASFPDAIRVAMATLQERSSAQSIILLENASGPEYANETCSIPAQGVLLQRLKYYPHPLALSESDFEVWLRWANEFRPEHAAEIETLGNTGARVAVPLQTKNEIVGVLLLGAPNGRDSYTAAEKQVLSHSAEMFALLLENGRLTGRVVEQEKLRRELQVASEVQMRLFPEKSPETASISCAGLCIPARGVGGDYYDFLDLGSGMTGIALADVAGKGIAAAIIMSVVQASLRSLAETSFRSLADLAARINRLLHRSTGSSSYATFFYAQYNESTRVLRYVNAGHNPPYVWRGRDGSIEELPAGGTIIGMFAQACYEEAAITLEPGDVFMAFSDGVSEAHNRTEEEFSEDRVKEVLARTARLPVSEMSAQILAELRQWMANAEQYDDLTFLLMKIR